MRIALDPFLHRHRSLEDLPGKVADLGYEWIELSLRADFREWFRTPRVFPGRIARPKRALSAPDARIASLRRWIVGQAPTRPNIKTACISAREDPADHSGVFVRADMECYIDKHWDRT